MSSGVVGGLVVSPLKLLLGTTAVVALFSVPMAAALNTTALKAIFVTVGVTAENAQNIDAYIDEGKAAVGGPAPAPEPAAEGQ